MLSIYICEDNETQLKLYCDYVNKAILMKDYNTKLEYITKNPLDLLKHIETRPKQDFGLYFIDIDLKCNTMDGLKLAIELRKIDSRGFIVFITTHSEMSFMALQSGVEPLDYILKDISKTIKQQIAINIERAYERSLLSYSKNINNIALTSGGRDFFLNPIDITYIDSSIISHKLEIHTNHEIISIYGSLKDILKKLPDNFYRSHKSFIINIDFVKEIIRANKSMILTNGDEIPVSAQYIKKIQNGLSNKNSY